MKVQRRSSGVDYIQMFLVCFHAIPIDALNCERADRYCLTDITESDT